MKRSIFAIACCMALAGNAQAFQKKTTPAATTAKAAPPPVQQAPAPTPAAIKPVAPAPTTTNSTVKPVKPVAKKVKAEPTLNSEAAARDEKQKLDAALARIKSIPKPPAVSAESRAYIRELNRRLDEELAK